uniref:Hypothetical chloroplast RF1 n=1 Tax=Trentepohlia odorata TaxID=2576626 RepID=A0A4Y5P3G8_9CHLO|nr:hypothetical chloroplast RF1 [Trentepohlia odorata]QCW57810.1 hypothetical chloroplast RF1 [Trentepohlia odorata]
MLSVFGIVFGEICFIFLLILPPPYIQFTLWYLESIWPYLFGLGLIVFVIFEGIKINLINLWTDIDLKNINMNIKRKPFKVFLLCFLLSLTEQSCCFAYFGSLNFNSTANFFDTYIFSVSGSPMIFIFSCLGFFIGSVCAITIYNFFLSQLLYFLFLSWKQKNKIFSFIFSNYTRPFRFLWVEKKRRNEERLRSKFIKWWDSPNKNLSNLSESLLFIFQSYKTIQPISRFLNLFSVINSYFSGIFTYYLNKITQNNNTAYRQRKYLLPRFALKMQSVEGKKNKKNEQYPATVFDYNSFNLSVYPLSSIGEQSIKEESTIIHNQIKNFPALLKKDKPFNWSILTGIDQFLVICLIIFSFTTIPFYSMDFIVNKFFGFIPQDQILNNYNLNNAMTDYTEVLGIPTEILYLENTRNEKVKTKNLLYELALFDQNHYGNMPWKTTFENLNYRNALHFSSFLHKYYNSKTTRKKLFAPTMRKLRNKLFPYYQGLKNTANKYGKLNNNLALMQLSKNIFLVDPQDFLNDTMRKKNIRNFEEAFSVMASNVLNSDPDGFRRWSRYWGPRIIIDDPIQYTSGVTFSPFTFDEYLKETLNPSKPLNIDELKKSFAYKYFHNPISKFILSNDLKNFLKHQPLSQQLTDVQEKDLGLLRVKMAHYYDSLRFYFNLKNHVHRLKNSFEQNSNLSSLSLSQLSGPSQEGTTGQIKTTNSSSNSVESVLKQNNQVPTLPGRTDRFYKNLQYPPMIAKSISSLNYHQQFKGSYDVVRELYDISLYNNNENIHNIFPQQTPKSERFLEDYQEIPASNEISIQSDAPTSNNLSKFALPIQSFDNSYKSFKSSENKSSLIPSSSILTNQRELKSYSQKEKEIGSKIKKTTLGVFDSLISRVKNQLYQIDLDLVNNSTVPSEIPKLSGWVFRTEQKKTKNFLPSNGWLADRKALLSYDKSLFNEYDYNEDSFLHEEAKIINSKNNLWSPSIDKKSIKEENKFIDEHKKNSSNDQIYRDPKAGSKSLTGIPFFHGEKDSSIPMQNQDYHNSLVRSVPDDHRQRQNINDFIKMNKKFKESTNPFYVGWDKKLRKFILTSRIIHRPYYLTQQIDNNENKQLSLTAKQSFAKPLDSKQIEYSSDIFFPPRFALKMQSGGVNNSKALQKTTTQASTKVSKPHYTEYYSSWPFMGEKITSFKSNKYSGLYTNRRFISDNPKNQLSKNLQTYYYENFPYVEILSGGMIEDYTEIFDYYYYKNSNSIKQIFPRLYMPNNILKYFSPLTNSKQTILSPTSSTFLWSGTEDISSNYPIALLVNIEKKLLGYESYYLDQKIKERKQYRIDHINNNKEINFKSNNFLFDKKFTFFKKKFRFTFPNLWYKILDYQNHIIRNFEINEELEEQFWYNIKNIIKFNRSLFLTEYLYPQEIKEDFYLLPNYKYPENLQYTLGEIRILQQGYDDGIEYSNNYQIPPNIDKIYHLDTTDNT